MSNTATDQKPVADELWSFLGTLREALNKPELLAHINERTGKHNPAPLPDNITIRTTADVKLTPDELDCLGEHMTSISYVVGGDSFTVTMEELEEYVTKHCDDSNQRLSEHQHAAVKALNALHGKCSEVNFYI